MMIPPIVGVPALAWWPSGPSSRMFWPNSRSRRNSMNFGERKMQMSSEAVPAIRTSPMRRRLHERLGDRLERDAPGRLDEHDVAGLDDVPGDDGGLGGVGGGEDVAGERAGGLPGQRADGHEHVDPGGGRVLAEGAV